MSYPQQKTHEEFLQKVYDNNKHYREGVFEVMTEYTNVKVPVLVKNKYGFIKITPNSLFSGAKPCGESAIDKNKYFENVLKEYGVELELLDTKNLRETIFNTKYGLCKKAFSTLKSFKKPNISSAIDKTQFMINEFIETHGLLYDYDKSDYKNAKTKIKIRCKEHGVFLQGYSQHKMGQGCPECSEKERKDRVKNNGGWTKTDWQSLGNTSKSFESYKVYIIHCWDEHESFYKIGRTFKRLKKRFNSNRAMPYNYDIVRIFEGSGDSMRMYYFEKYLLNKNKKHRYLPKKEFSGKNECFTTVEQRKNNKILKMD